MMQFKNSILTPEIRPGIAAEISRHPLLVGVFKQFKRPEKPLKTRRGSPG
jgi:hypothetical protein